MHDEPWLNNICWSDTDKAIIGFVDDALWLFVGNADERAVLCCQCAATGIEFAVLSTNFLKSEVFISEGVVMRSREKAKFTLIFCGVVLHEMRKGDTDKFTEFV